MNINMSEEPVRHIESQYEDSIQFGCDKSTVETLSQLATESGLAGTEVARRIFLAALKDQQLLRTALELDQLLRE